MFAQKTLKVHLPPLPSDRYQGVRHFVSSGLFWKELRSSGHAMEGVPSDVLENFKRFDTDQSGSISRDELTSVAHAL